MHILFSTFKKNNVNSKFSYSIKKNNIRNTAYLIPSYGYIPLDTARQNIHM